MLKPSIYLLSLFLLCNISLSLNLKRAPLYSGNNFEVLGTYKRTPTYYTQGVFFSDDGKTLYESGGLYGESVLVKMDYPSLKIIKKMDLARNYFAEGIARCGDFLYQLTWQENVILKYKFPELTYDSSIKLDGKIREGWGLSNFGSDNELIASDGSEYIYVLDCDDNLKVKKTVTVKEGGEPVDKINALAFVNGFIFANKYYDKRILKINPVTGVVEESFDMQPLIDYEFQQNTLNAFALNSGDVLNGIAYDDKKKVFLVTGKRWGYYYEVLFK
jgi:glutamine cyclotransferase